MNRQEINQFIKVIFNLPLNFKHRTFREEAIQISSTDGNTDMIEVLAKIRAGASANRAGEIVSSVHGKIKAILISYPYYRGRFDLQRDVIIDLLEKMDKTVDVYVFSNYCKREVERACDSNMSQILKDLQQIISTAKGKIYFFKSKKSNSDFSSWIRDPFVITQDKHDQKVELLEPIRFSRFCEVSNLNQYYRCKEGAIGRDDSSIANHIAEIRNLPSDAIIPTTDNSPLVFHGGNVLTTDEHIFIGEDYYNVEVQKTEELIKLNAPLPSSPEMDHLLSTDEKLIKQRFQEWLSPTSRKKIIKIGAPPPEVFSRNIDPIEHKGKLYKTDILYQGKQQPFFHLDLFITPLGRKTKDSAYQIFLPQLVNASGLASEDLYTKLIFPWNEWITTIARQLLNLGFEIKYLPAPVTYFQTRMREYQILVFTYNNCLIEVHEDYRKVWMPSLGGDPGDKPKVIYHEELAHWDKVAINTFEEQRIIVEKLRNYVPLMMQGGAIHCLTNYLMRTP